MSRPPPSEADFLRLVRSLSDADRSSFLTCLSRHLIGGEPLERTAFDWYVSCGLDEGEATRIVAQLKAENPLGFAPAGQA